MPQFRLTEWVVPPVIVPLLLVLVVRAVAAAWVELSCRLVSGTDEYVCFDVGRHDSRRAEKRAGGSCSGAT